MADAMGGGDRTSRADNNTSDAFSFGGDSRTGINVSAGGGFGGSSTIALVVISAAVVLSVYFVARRKR